MADQVRRAVAWVYKNTTSLGGDPNRIYISRHSSGGHLAGVVMITDGKKIQFASRHYQVTGVE
jgi:arylformamidase